MKRLNFASGPDRRPGYVNMDIAKLAGVDIVHDFNKFPYPFKAGTFDEIYASHALEHVNNLMKVMEEFDRILKPNGVVKVLVPYFASPNSHRDPTHKIWFTSATFTYVEPGHYYSTASFKTTKKRLIFFSNAGFMKSRWYSWPFDLILNAILPVYERFFCYILPASEIHFLLEKGKKSKQG
jgi:ubiquinone/menaquinone biosynthesis C-methylase UbiE